MKTQTKPIPIHDLTNKLLTNLEHNHQERHLTGFKNLDDNFDGFSSGDLVLVGGRPGMGKTQFAVNLMANLCQNQVCLYFALDLSMKDVAARFLACKTGIEAHHLKSGKVAIEDHEPLNIANNFFENSKLSLTDIGIDDPKSILDAIQTQAKQSQTKVVVIDDLQTLFTGIKKSKINQQIQLFLNQLKSLATALNLIVIVLSQLTREVEKRKSHLPKLSDFTGDRSDLHSVDKVWLLYRPAYYGIQTFENGTESEKLMQLTIAKNNKGKEGIVHFKIDSNFTHFTAAEPLVFKPLIKSQK